MKATDENLQGEPEVKVVGFPVGLQAVGAVAGGAALRKSMEAVDLHEKRAAAQLLQDPLVEQLLVSWLT